MKVKGEQSGVYSCRSDCINFEGECELNLFDPRNRRIQQIRNWLKLIWRCQAVIGFTGQPLCFKDESLFIKQPEGQLAKKYSRKGPKQIMCLKLRSLMSVRADIVYSIGHCMIEEGTSELYFKARLAAMKFVLKQRINNEIAVGIHL